MIFAVDEGTRAGTCWPMRLLAVVCLALTLSHANASELVNTARLRLREAPSLSAHISRLLATGTSVELLSSKNEGQFFNVRLQNDPQTTGWVSGKYVADTALGTVKNERFTLRRFPKPEGLAIASKSTKYPDCGDAHFFRWKEKTVLPSDGQPAVATVKQVLAWAPLPIGKDLASWCEVRSGRELKQYSVTGWVRTIRPEDDGDLHVELTSTATAPVTSCVVVEIPPESYGQVFADAKGALDNAIPATDRTGPTVKHPTRLRFEGLAFFDGWHATAGLPSGHGHCNSTKGAVWELHPVAKVSQPL